MRITKNILVHIEYKLSDENNNHLNPDEGELIYLHGGYGHIFDKLENTLEGKKAGDTFKATFAPSEAFGEFDEQLIVQEPLSELPEDVYVGMELDTSDEDSQSTNIYVVTDILNDCATLDANHPLAGLTVTFDGTITELEELTEEGIKEILAHEDHEH